MASRAASCPISPRPTTTTFDPGTRLGEPQRVQGDGRDRGERRVLRRDTPAGTGAQSSPGTAWNSAWFALPAPPVATSWPGRIPVTAAAGLQHDPGGGVAERHVLGQPAEDRLAGGGDPLGAGLPHHLPDQVGPGPRLGQQARLGQRGHGALRARRDHRRDRADQHLGRLRHRARHVEQRRPGRR